MLKVAHVIYSFNIGGAEILLREAFENKIIKEETDSWLIVLHRKHLGLLPDLKTKKIKVFDLFSIRFLLEYFNLLRFLKGNEFQVIHTHLPLAGIILLSMRLFGLSVRVIYTEHSMITSYRKSVYILLGLLYKFFYAVVFISDEVQKNVLNSKHDNWFYSYMRGQVIYNGINVEKFIPRTNLRPRERYVIGTIASMRKEKRLDRWVEIANEINTQYPGCFYFIIGGDGSERLRVEESVNKHNLKHLVSLPGMISKTHEVFAEFDIFLMTSDFEGLGVALLEAMACGCVPVASNVGGIQNIAFDSFGLKYKIGDNKEILNFVASLLRDEDKLMSYKKDAREYVSENFSIEKQLKALLVLYQKP